MAAAGCTLSILAGAADLPFLREVVAHLRRVHRHAFTHSCLVVDTCRDGANPPPAAQLGALAASARELAADGLVDSVVALDEFHSGRGDTLARHLRPPPRGSRDFRGVPLAGWIAGLEAQASPPEYHLHFDCDVLVHAGDDWVARGIELLATHRDWLCVAPHPGPPAADGRIRQAESYQTADEAWLFGTFSSRRFLIARSRLAELLPLALGHASRRLRLRALLSGHSSYLNWEMMMSRAMRGSGLVRAMLRDRSAWALHCPCHDQAFVSLLPKIVAHVERGEYPAAQAGRYDLDLDRWRQFPGCQTRSSDGCADARERR